MIVFQLIYSVFFSDYFAVNLLVDFSEFFSVGLSSSVPISLFSSAHSSIGCSSVRFSFNLSLSFWVILSIVFSDCFSVNLFSFFSDCFYIDLSVDFSDFFSVALSSSAPISQYS